MTKASVKNALKKGCEIENYRIDKTLSSGGFSIVYLATNTTNNEKVVIKEYLPVSMAKRAKDDSVQCISGETASSFKIGFRKFLEEAAALARVNHPNIVRVQNFLRANNTVYMVMDHEKGKELRHYIKQYRGNLTEKFIRTVFYQLLLGLDELHRNKILHLDIKPANIFLRPGGNPLLLDFGAARHATARSKQKELPHTLTRGFSPIEQHQHKPVGPFSDIYALGASVYACMKGSPPPSATDRIKKDKFKPAGLTSFGRDYSAELLDAVDWCLSLHPLDRPQQAKDLLPMFTPTVEPESTTPWYMTPLSALLGGKR